MQEDVTKHCDRVEKALCKWLIHSSPEVMLVFECLYIFNRTYLDENRDLFEVRREMEEGGYTEYQYDYNGKNLAQLIDECVR